MPIPLFTNNAATALAVAVTPTDTLFQVVAGTGEQFPSPTGGNYFMMTMVQINNPEVSEIVKCIGRTGDFLTVERGQEGTAPQIFNISDNAQLRITAQSLNLFAQGGSGGGSGAATNQAEFTATQGQTVFTLPFSYIPDDFNLAVFVNGSKQIVDVNYSESSSTTVSFITGLNVGDLVEVIYNLPIAAGQVDASNISYDEGDVGAVESTVQKKLQESVSIKDFGAMGDGVTDDSSAINNAISSGKQLLIPIGTYLINNNVTFSTSPIVQEGAIFKVRNSSVLTFNNGIEAGWYTIFDTTDDFITDLTINTSVLILGCPVKADWFASKVQNIANIKTISDQANNLTKAFRASVGNYIYRSATQYINQYQQGVVELGIGYYRIDKTLAFGKQTAPTTYYQLGGFTFKGQGTGSSYLIRTNLTSTDIIVNLSFYTAQLTRFEEFTINCYDPDSGTPYTGYTKACMYMQGDSLQINNVWVSGGQTATLNGDAYQNGVGFQFASCIDTYFHDLFVEYCVTGIAFNSSIVSGTNLTLFHTLNQAMAIGNMVSDYGVSQTTSSKVSISNIQANSTYNQGLFVLETGPLSEFNISDSFFNGYDSQISVQAGGNFCNMHGSTQLKGVWTGVSVESFSGQTFNVENGCYLGNYDRAFVLDGFTVYNDTSSTPGSGVFIGNGTTAAVNLFCTNLSCNNVYGTIIGGFASGNIVIENVTLSVYTGAADVSTNRQLFTIGNGTTAPNLYLKNWIRNTSDTVALTQFGYAGGACNIYIDINNLYNATRTVAGTPTTVKMPSYVTFA